MAGLAIFEKINQRLEKIKDIYFLPKEGDAESLAEALSTDEETLKFIAETAELIFKASPTLKDVIESYGNLCSEKFDPYVVVFMAFHSGVVYGFRKALEVKEDS